VADTWDAGAGAETQYLIGPARIVWQVGSHSGAGFQRDARITWNGTDLLGSTGAVVDLVSGALLERSTYLPSGVRETLRMNDDVADVQVEPVGFTGKEADDEVGLTYFGHRYLMPHLGRWASPDPLQVHSGGGGEFGNSYHYVSGNLLQATDPNGLVTVRTDGTILEGSADDEAVPAQELDGTWVNHLPPEYVSGNNGLDAETNEYVQGSQERLERVAAGAEVASEAFAATVGVLGGIGSAVSAGASLGAAIAGEVGGLAVSTAAGEVADATTDDPTIRAVARVAGGLVGGGVGFATGGRAAARSLSAAEAAACFVAGTLVTTGDGNTLSIESVRVGQRVAVHDSSTSQSNAADTFCTVSLTTYDAGMLAGEVTLLRSCDWVADREIAPGSELTLGHGTRTLSAVVDTVSVSNIQLGRGRVVTGVYHRVSDSIWRLTLKNGERIEATGEHPFYSESGWTQLNELLPGTLVLTTHGWTSVQYVEPTHSTSAVVNLEVE